MRHLSKVWAAAAILSVLGALLLMRAYSRNSFNVGWGDAAADRYQSSLWWGAIACGLLTLGFAVLLSICSRRAMLSIVVGAATALVLGFLMKSLPNTAAKVLFIPQLPGWFGAVYLFGIHSGGFPSWAAMLSINAIIYAFLVSFLWRNKYRTQITASASHSDPSAVGTAHS